VLNSNWWLCPMKASFPIHVLLFPLAKNQIEVTIVFSERHARTHVRTHAHNVWGKQWPKFRNLKCSQLTQLILCH